MRNKVFILLAAVCMSMNVLADSPGRIYRVNGKYMCNDTQISSRKVERILQLDNGEAYKRWKKAKEMRIGGSVLVGLGGGMVIGGLMFIRYKPMWSLGLSCGALVPIGVGLGLSIGASSHYNQAIDLYNSRYDQAAVQLRWGVTADGVGLAIAF